MKVVVGVSTYGMIDQVQGFIRSFLNSQEETGREILTVCVDDGTPNRVKVRERRDYCHRNGFQFIAHDRNRGIPAAWNSILNYAKDQDAYLTFIFNDDIRMMAPGWLTRMIYFFDNNEGIGTVGFPLVHTPGFDDNDARWGVAPGIVGAAVGCSFAVKTDVALSIENPDGSKGYWDDLISFHEEVHAGFRLAQMGYPSFMLPWPPVHHKGGQTFGGNPELTFRDPSPYLSIEEFLNYSRSSAFYLKEYEPYYEKGKVDRMMYSRAMFCKYWGILDMDRKMEIDGIERDIWNEPQIYVHQLVVPKRLEKEIVWINKAGKQEKTIV